MLHMDTKYLTGEENKSKLTKTILSDQSLDDVTKSITESDVRTVNIPEAPASNKYIDIFSCKGKDLRS